MKTSTKVGVLIHVIKMFKTQKQQLLIAGIYHFILVVMMLPLSWLGRGFYRRKEEGKLHPKQYRNEQPLLKDKEMMTSVQNLSYRMPQALPTYKDTTTWTNNNYNNITSV